MKKRMLLPVILTLCVARFAWPEDAYTQSHVATRPTSRLSKKAAATQPDDPVLAKPKVKVTPVVGGLLLEWTAVPGTDGYILYRYKPAPPGNPPIFTAIGVAVDNQTAQIDRDPVQGTFYLVLPFKVSEASDAVAAVPPLATPPQAMPEPKRLTDFGATRTNFVGGSHSQVRVTWQRSEGAAGYHVKLFYDDLAHLTLWESKDVGTNSELAVTFSQIPLQQRIKVEIIPFNAALADGPSTSPFVPKGDAPVPHQSIFACRVMETRAPLMW